MRHWLWSRLVPALAAVKVAMGLAAFFLTYGQAVGSDPIYPYPLYFLFIVAFGATAALLLLGGRDDARAFSLGAFFLVGATAWANTPLGKLSQMPSVPGGLFFSAVNALELDAFLAFYLWVFARDFPQPPASPVARRRITFVVWIAAAAGLFFFSLNALRFLVTQGPEGLGRVLGWFAPQRGTGLYYAVTMPLVAGALPVLIWKAWMLRGPDQRRLRVFLEALAITFGPMLIEILLELFGGSYLEYTRSHPRLRLGITLAVCSIGLTVPVTIPYAVLVHRVLDVKLIARRALRYALARTSVLILVAIPLTSLAAYLFAHRSYSLAELFSGVRVLLLAAAIAVGVAALYYRKALLELIDRRFFREQYDAQQILTLLVERIRSIREVESLASLVSREIDLALHLEGISMMVLEPRSGLLVDPRSRARRLDASSSLALTISNASDPLEVDLEDAHSPLRKLPEKERHWLVDSGFRLIVPILARDGSLVGLVGLGEKKSGLPFLKEDRRLLHAIASNAAWVLELELGQDRVLVAPRSWRNALVPDDATPAPAVEHAKECATCGTVYQPFTVFCSHCSRRLEVSRVPFVLPGKFRFEKRIGVGGMGVVYQGADLALGRPVAIKTLRRVSPEDAMRLRREARTAAAVSHPHLAAVYGMETWEGTPLLVMELLEGGTLAHKMPTGQPMTPVETVDLGIAMAEALAYLHAEDILHRDIKPSNIGYTRDGSPKLMDFGIAGLLPDLRREEDLALLSGTEDDSLLVPPASVWGQGGNSPGAARRHQFAGTLSYLSPEALNGDPPDASFDLWSLGIVLYECLLGRKVFTGGDSRQLMARIRHGRVPEFFQVLPEYDPVLGDLFRRMLHRTRARRPATARELRQWLLEVRPRAAGLEEDGPAA